MNDDDADVGGGDDGGVLEEEDRRRWRWTSPKNTLPKLAMVMYLRSTLAGLKGWKE